MTDPTDDPTGTGPAIGDDTTDTTGPTEGTGSPEGDGIDAPGGYHAYNGGYRRSDSADGRGPDPESGRGQRPERDRRPRPRDDGAPDAPRPPRPMVRLDGVTLLTDDGTYADTVFLPPEIARRIPPDVLTPHIHSSRKPYRNGEKL